MIKINLLPHREEKRKRLKNDFYSLLLFAGIVGVVIVIIMGTIFSRQLSAQTDRNSFINAENLKLDEKIKEVASLKQEIDGLKARQQAVEDLQGDRNQPVYMLDELVKLTPEGVYLKTLKQEGQRILLNGYAQSNQRVAEFLFNLGNKSAWMIKPELIEIKSTGIGQGRDAKKVFDFSMNVGIRRPREVESSTSSASSASNSAASAVAVKP
ncbi:MAG: PilN domain-containing protein [Undibacterium sp.]|uniref:PilN domain-containing protein n=1 Tax=Undibacterium sp. TaxID=1914977 RepID=UPI0027160CF2|nr:PilN domain-containing protein [Undibacterium sp.]MDO8651065.1 PilN domain-containing protein [Undibacterium sp.]